MNSNNTLRTQRPPGTTSALRTRLRATLCLGLLHTHETYAFIQTSDSATDTALTFTAGLTIVLLLLILLVVFVLNGNVEPMVRLMRRLWDYVVPKSTEKTSQFDEDYDGIAELDNRIPPWFNYLFIGTILFAIVYMLDYHVWGTSPLPQAEYAQEVAAADLLHRMRTAAEGSINEDELTALADDASLKSGQERFVKNCTSCHGSHGEGIVGPNLTDRYWVHGGGIRNVYAVIKNGVPAKGMISWKLVFTPKEIQQIASFVLSLQGTNPPNGKKAEGDLYTEPKAPVKNSSKVGT